MTERNKSQYNKIYIHCDCMYIMLKNKHNFKILCRDAHMDKTLMKTYSNKIKGINFFIK